MHTNTPEDTSPWWDAPAAAAYAGVHAGTILREARAHRLRGYKVGGRRLWRFRREDVDTWLARYVREAVA